MAAGVAYPALTIDRAPQRVAFVASYAPSLTGFRGPLIREIIARGHKLLCAAPDFDDQTRSKLMGWGAETYTIPLGRTGLNPLRDLATARALTKLFTDWRPDLVMGYTPKPAIYATLAARKAGVPRIIPMITGLGYAFLEGGGVKRKIIRRVMAVLYARAFSASHGVIFHNNEDCGVFAELGLLPEGLPVTVVRGSGVDLAHFSRCPLPSLDDGVTFLMIARLVGYKGVEEYCQAAGMLANLGVKARWLLVGPPETGPAGFPLSELRKYEDVVTYLGSSKDVRQHLRQCHVYVLPSYGEGMPRTVLEALATGRPIITTRTRGCRETVLEGVNGFLVPIRDAESLAAAMRNFLDKPDLIGAMAPESRKLAEGEFDVAHVNKAMLKALGLDARAPA